MGFAREMADQIRSLSSPLDRLRSRCENDWARVAAHAQPPWVRDRASSRLACSRPMRSMPYHGPGTCGQGSADRNTPRDRARPRAVLGPALAAKPEEGMKRARYTVVFEQDESGAWIVWVPSVPGCHTYGRSLNEARKRIREALSLFVRNARTAELSEQIRLPAEIRQAVQRGTSARRRADRATREAQRAASDAARRLIEAGYSLRDAATLLGLSHQRVAQLLAEDRADRLRKVQA